MARLGGPVVRLLLHRHGRLTANAIHYSLAWSDPRGPGQQRDGMGLALDVGLTGFTLGIERVEGEVEVIKWMHVFGEGAGLGREMLGRMFAQSSLKDRDLAQGTLALAPSHKEEIAMIFAQIADSDKGWSALSFRNQRGDFG